MMTDVLAENGVVQVIDTVLIPQSVEIGISDILEGMGSFTLLLKFLSETDLSMYLNGSTPVTLFAPDDDAFLDVDDLAGLETNMTRLKFVLQSLIVPEDISMLNASMSYKTLNNLTLHIISEEQIELENPADTVQNQGTSMILWNSTATHTFGYIYVLDTVLGVPQEKSSGGGLETWQIVLIVVGGVVIGLLLLAIVAAIAYVAFFRPKTGYSKIN